MRTAGLLSFLLILLLSSNLSGATRGEIYGDFLHFWKVLREKRDRVESIYLEEKQYLKSQKIEQARVAYYHGKVAFTRGLSLLDRVRSTYSMEPGFIKVLEERLRDSFHGIHRYSQWIVNLKEEDLESRRLGLKPSILIADRKYHNIRSNRAIAGRDLIQKLKKAVELYDLRTNTTLLYARDALENLKNSYPDFLPAKLWLARTHFELEEVQTARAILDELEREDPEFRIARSLDAEMMAVDPLLLRILPQEPITLPPEKVISPPREAARVTNPGTQVQRVPFGFVLGNTKMERPQSGISRASVVYEMPVEGGITRLLALFSLTREKSIPIGPIRSLRPYILEEIFPFDPLLVHCGASIGGTRALRDLGLDTVDQLRDFLPFWRKESSPSPYNLYTSLQKLEDLAFARRKLLGDALEVIRTSGKGYPFEENQTKSVHLELSPQYTVSYHLNPELGAFERRINGVLQKDAYDNSLIIVQNLIIQRVPESIQDQTGLKRLKTIGEGKITAFVRGKEMEGIWRKSSVESRTLYLDQEESEILFLPSLTWIHMVSPNQRIRVDQWERIPNRLSSIPNSR